MILEAVYRFGSTSCSRTIEYIYKAISSEFTIQNFHKIKDYWFDSSFKTLVLLGFIISTKENEMFVFGKVKD